MHKALSIAAIAAFAALSSGCSNACQAICHDMAAYAEECGFTVADGQLDQCMDDFSSAGLPDGQKDVCKEHGGNLKEEWSCQDVGDYFGD